MMCLVLSCFVVSILSSLMVLFFIMVMVLFGLVVVVMVVNYLVFSMLDVVSRLCSCVGVGLLGIVMSVLLVSGMCSSLVCVLSVFIGM